MVADFTVLKIILRELMRTDLSTAIGRFSDCSEWNRFTTNVDAPYSNENERPDTKTIVLHSLSKVRLSQPGSFANCIQVACASSRTWTASCMLPRLWKGKECTLAHGNTLQRCRNEFRCSCSDMFGVKHPPPIPTRDSCGIRHFCSKKPQTARKYRRQVVYEWA